MDAESARMLGAGLAAVGAGLASLGVGGLPIHLVRSFIEQVQNSLTGQ